MICEKSFIYRVYICIGLALIIKAEFDSLKNNFQAQIDTYNQNIDSKIDSAIAAYLTGVAISTNREYNILVDNYSQIRWMDAHKMKLNTVTFSNATTKNETSSSEYITPYYENRRNILANYIQIYDFISDFSWGGAMCHFYLVWKEDDNITTKLHYGNQSKGTADAGWIPVAFLRLKRDVTTKKYYIESIVNENCWLTKISSFGHGVTGQYNFYYVANDDFAPKVDGFTINEPDENAYLSYRVDFSNNTHWFSSAMNASNTWIAGPWQEYRFNDISMWSSYTKMNDNYGKYEYPVHYNYNKSTTQVTNDEQNLFNLMLGTDDDVTVNCCKYYEDLDIVNGQFYDWSDSYVEKKKGYVTEATYNGGKITNAERTNQPQDPSKGQTVEINFGVPLFPRYSLRTLLTGKFKDKGTGLDLSIGAGLPIVKSLDAKKILTITFDYNKVNTEVGSLVTPNKKIYVTLKKSNFETIGGTDFLTGSVNGGVKQTLNKVEVTGGQAKIEIDCEKGDNVWLRIANTTDGSEPGIYTTMTNLKVIGTIED